MNQHSANMPGVVQKTKKEQSSSPHQINHLLTKIVATLGPAIDTDEKLSELLQAGASVLRLNLSHGTQELHKEQFMRASRVREQQDKHIAILADLQGPKIRLGKFGPPGAFDLRKGDAFSITTRPILGDAKNVSTTHTGLTLDVSAGDLILIDDGRVRLVVESVSADTVHCRVDVGGTVSSNKGLNLPGAAVSVPALSQKDVEDLKFCLDLGVDAIALSFVRSAADLAPVKAIMGECGVDVPVIAKIEKPQAVEAIEEIIDAFDGIMVARGDLGVELALQDVPPVQKRLVRLARQKAKPVIVATQILESMIHSPIPTRAEVSDCANAILDGADAVMLSAETSVGQHPVQCVRTMAEIIHATERYGIEHIEQISPTNTDTPSALAAAAKDIGQVIGTQVYCVFTESGGSLRRICALRPAASILAFTPSLSLARFMSMCWGVEAVLVDRVAHTDAIMKQVDTYLLEHNLQEKGREVVVLSGMPPGTPGSTNDLRVHTVGSTL